MSELPRYRPSGGTSPWLIPAGLGAVGVGVLLAWPYQALVTWVPYIYINLVVYAGFAIALAVVVHLGSTLGRNRNRWLGALLGIVVAASAVGASHYFAYQRAVGDFQDEVESLTASGEIAPEDVKTRTFHEFITARLQGGWSLGRRTADGKGDITGPLVWLFWSIEAVGLLAVAVYGGMRVSPYCEDCRVSLDKEPLFVRHDIDLGSIGELKSARSVEDIVTMPPRPDVAHAGIRVNYACHACKTCMGATYLTVTQHWTEGDEERSEELHEEVVMSRAQLDQLRALGVQLAEMRAA